MLAGSGGVVSWLDDHNVWATSTAFAEAPDPDVQAFVDAHPAGGVCAGQVWDRLQRSELYTGEDDGVGEAPPRGWTAVFPHPLAGAAGHARRRSSTSLWETEPVSPTRISARWPRTWSRA